MYMIITCTVHPVPGNTCLIPVFCTVHKQVSYKKNLEKFDASPKGFFPSDIYLRVQELLNPNVQGAETVLQQIKIVKIVADKQQAPISSVQIRLAPDPVVVPTSYV